MDEVESVTEDTNYSPYFVNDFRYRKKGVSYSEEWSQALRVSDNLNTYNSAGGNIIANESVTFGVSVKGQVHGLDITLTGSKTSAVGYSQSVGPNRRVYLGYKVRYKVETGTREYYDLVTGKVMSSNAYTVKTPIFGEYVLINYY